MWPKGANSLSDLFKVFVRWRFYTHGIVWDLSKAYNALRTGPEEMFLRLCVWRNMDTTREFTVYGCISVMFGDRPAANCLEVAKELAAKEGKDIDPVAADKIVQDSYIDDALSGSNDVEEVGRLVGKQSVMGDGK